MERRSATSEHESFHELRDRVHRNSFEATQKRIAENPKPTEQELFLGVFIEQIEEQVRDAVVGFFESGYTSESSGFGGEDSTLQTIDGFFSIDVETEKKLRSIGVTVQRGAEIGMDIYPDYTSVSFVPESANVSAIKAKWQHIVSLLPKLSTKALPSIQGGTENFIRKYAPERTDLEKAVLERRLKIVAMSSESRAQIKKRLKELS